MRRCGVCHKRIWRSRHCLAPYASALATRIFVWQLNNPADSGRLSTSDIMSLADAVTSHTFPDDAA